jgi:hypothetical protein
MKRLSSSREQRTWQLLSSEDIGDRKPSQFLRYLRNLAPDVPVYLLRGIWISRLPSTIQTHLAGRPDIDLETAAHCMDCIMETISAPALTTVAQPVNDLNSKQCLEELFRLLEALGIGSNNSKYGDRRSRTSQSRYRYSGFGNRPRANGSRSRDDAATSYCWYRRRYGTSAQKCFQPCTYRSKGKQAQKASASELACTPTTGHLSIAEKSTKQRFLIGTSSDLCVFPRKLIPQRRTRVNYDLCAANGTTIPTYGWLPLRLKLGLRRDFTW